MLAVQESMDGISSQVSKSLCQADPRLSRITVEVDASSVKLTGTVPTYYLRALAISTVNRMSGLGSIDDRIAVPFAG